MLRIPLPQPPQLANPPRTLTAAGLPTEPSITHPQTTPSPLRRQVPARFNLPTRELLSLDTAPQFRFTCGSIARVWSSTLLTSAVIPCNMCNGPVTHYCSIAMNHSYLVSRPSFSQWIRMKFRHFVQAQERIYDQVLRELAMGRKCSHWMWFIFPQLRGLGHSLMSEQYAIESLAHARDYLNHHLLGPRLCECTELVVHAKVPTVDDIFGYPDCLKFRSSVTLFSICAPSNSVFARALHKCFMGEPDERTLYLLNMRRTTRESAPNG